MEFFRFLSKIVINISSTRFNQVTVAYDASKEERLEALKLRRTEVEDRLREK